MTLLNSCIIDGDIESVTLAKSLGFTEFVVKSTRTVKDTQTGEDMDIISMIPCRAEGVFKETAAQRCTPGQAVRVVGRLEGSPDSSLYILCEHIEYRLGRSKKKE